MEQEPAIAPTSKAVSEPQAPRFAGKFDLYSTKLPFLLREYLPSGASAPDFEAVHSKIQFYQAKSDFSLRIILAEGGAGRFACALVANPMSDEELGPIRISGRSAPAFAFDEDEAAHESTVGTGPGYTGRLTLDTSRSGCGMIQSGTGNIKMRRVWEKNGQELFEGFWDLRVSYGPTLRRKSFGSGGSYAGAFWGVRGRKDAEGNEIGIGL